MWQYWNTSTSRFTKSSGKSEISVLKIVEDLRNGELSKLQWFIVALFVSFVKSGYWSENNLYSKVSVVVTHGIHSTIFFFSLVLFKVYCIDQTYTTIRVPVSSSVKEVISAVADKLGSGEGLIIVKMSSGGGTVFASS